MNRTIARASLTIAVLLAAPLVAGGARAGNVLVVDPANPGAFAQIQPAVDLASDGDTVLVKSGYYGGFAILDKAVNVVGDSNQSAVVSGTIAVRSLSAGKDVLISGLFVTGLYSSQPWEGHGLYLKNDAGSVRIQECTIQSDNSFPAPASRHAAAVEGCADVVFARCTLRGGPGFWHTGGVVGDGIAASGSRIALYECLVAGGRGSDGAVPVADGQDGGAGYRAADGYLFAEGGSITGGRGGDGVPLGGWDPAPPDGGGGGDGIRLEGASARVELFQAYLPPAAGGAHGNGSATCPTCPGTDGAPGQALAARRDQVRLFPGPRRILIAHSPVRELATFHVACDGAPNDLVFLRMTPATGFLPSTPWQGVLTVESQAPSLWMPLGATDLYLGNVSAGLAFPDLGPGAQSRTWHLQAFHRDVLGSWILGGSASVVVLDSAF